MKRQLEESFSADAGIQEIVGKYQEDAEAITRTLELERRDFINEIQPLRAAVAEVVRAWDQVLAGGYGPSDTLNIPYALQMALNGLKERRDEHR